MRQRQTLTHAAVTIKVEDLIYEINLLKVSLLYNRIIISPA